MMRLLTLISTLYASGVCACTIPVFRYALDRWEADKFHLVLPASAAQDTALQDLLRPLRANGTANLDIMSSRDVSVTMAELRNSRESSRLVWSGALNEAALAALLDSPARKKIVASMLAGDSFIWVIADSGSPEDAVEVERIEQRLRFLEQVASLPIQDPNDPDSQLGPGPPLRLKFTTLRLRRDDPAESVLLRMLAGPQGKVDPGTTSFAAAVFGRGRVLGAWPLALLDDAALEDASMFLVGRCGCRLKNENPGWDILLNVDWEKALQSVVSAAEPSASVTSAVPKAAAVPEVVRISAADDGEAAASKSGAIIMAVVTLGTVLLGVFCLRPKKAGV
ncbi:MAG: hypothetical protein ACKVY0_12940 [Prosthecobacter sp.]